MQPTASDALAILPFLFAAGGGLLVVLLDACTKPETPRSFLGGFVLLFLGAAALSAWLGLGSGATPAFSGLVVADDFSRYLTVLFAVAAGLGALIAMGRLPEEGTARGEFHALLLFSVAGASLLAQTADLITLFLGLETMSIPAYAMAAAIRRDPRSTEAGFKYFILGAFATGFLVFGIALLYGAAGSTQLERIAAVADGMWTDNLRLVFGALFLLVGLAFKIAAVPFHMWAPDVYCGAPTPATAYFAAGIKAAGFAALMRVLYLALPGMKIGPESLEGAGWHYIIMGLAYATMYVPTLIALVQKDVKRILAYSSVAHAGYLLIGLLAGEQGSAAILFYLAVYTFMTVGAFAIVAYFEHRDGGTDLAEYAGMAKRHPLAAAAMAIFLFSLAGIPPMGGFLAKFYLFRAAIGHNLIWLTVFAVMASMISAYYYLRIIVAMYMEQGQPLEDAPAVTPSAAVITAVAICVILVLVLGVYPTPVLAAAQAAALHEIPGLKERFRFRSFAAFRRMYASGTGFSWFLFFLCNNAYLWLFLKDPQTGTSPFWITLEFVAGTAFFLGFIVFVSGSLQPRRALHADRFAITEGDEEQLGAYRQTKRQKKFAAPLFLRACWAGIGFAVFHTGVSALLAHFFSPEGVSAGWFVFGLAAYSSFAAAGLTVAVSWASIARMRRWQQDQRRVEFGFFRYTVLQNALAALIVNVPLGFFYGHLKFPALAEQVAEIRGGAAGVPTLALAFDIGFSVLLIAALFGAAIRTKVATELMAEIQIKDADQVKGKNGRWVGWYSPILGLAAFGLIWMLGLIWPGDRFDAMTATIVKCVVQGLVGLGVGYWAASRTAMQMMRGGEGFNPFLRDRDAPRTGD